jgi:hypothetical protein
LTTKLEGPLKRGLLIGGEQYTLTVSPAGLLLVPKGRRKGLQLGWEDLVSGETALATALNASLAALAPRRRASPASTSVAAADKGRKARGGKAKSSG